MRLACRFDDPSAFIEMMKTRIAIGLQDAGEAGEVLLTRPVAVSSAAYSDRVPCR
jgi:hypothetical protein